jgi:hypothetical protein
MAFAETFAPFFADFGDDGTLAGQAVRGIYEVPVARDGIGDVLALAAQPQFTLATASVPANPFGAALVIPQGSFTVREHLPDGTGLSVLLLDKA